MKNIVVFLVIALSFTFAKAQHFNLTLDYQGNFNTKYPLMWRGDTLSMTKSGMMNPTMGIRSSVYWGKDFVRHGFFFRGDHVSSYKDVITSTSREVALLDGHRWHLGFSHHLDGAISHFHNLRIKFSWAYSQQKYEIKFGKQSAAGSEMQHWDNVIAHGASLGTEIVIYAWSGVDAPFLNRLSIDVLGSYFMQGQRSPNNWQLDAKLDAEFLRLRSFSDKYYLSLTAFSQIREIGPKSMTQVSPYFGGGLSFSSTKGNNILKVLYHRRMLNNGNFPYSGVDGIYLSLGFWI